MGARLEVDYKQFQHVTHLPFGTCMRQLDRKKYEQIMCQRDGIISLQRSWELCHPSISNFLSEIQKEQADTESILTQLSLGKTIKKDRARHLQRVQDRLFNIVSQYV